MRIEKGCVYLAGAGPGDPGLMTVRAAELLKGCDCIVYDALVSPEIMAQANPAAERVFAGKRGKHHTLEQSAINAVLACKARAGHSVLRLKGGDPYLFGRGAEEALALVEAGVRVQVVPGVTAGIAVPACAGIPVTFRHKASTVAFVTGHEDPCKPEPALDWAALSKIGTLCLYMGFTNLPRIAAELARHRSPHTPAAVIQWGSTPRQRTVTGTLLTIAENVRAAGLEPPALAVIGDAVACRSKLNFFERRPLFGRRIVVTRARRQAGELSETLAELGAEVLEFPAIRIQAPPGDELARALAQLAAGKFDWLVVTSANGADAVFEELARQRLDSRAVRAKVAAVGPATARALSARGIVPDLVPHEYTAESVAAALQEQGAVAGQKFLLARAGIACGELPAALARLGGCVTDAAAYQTVRDGAGSEAAIAALEAGQVDAVTFTSASTARHFGGILGPERLARILQSPRLRCFAIGPQTRSAMEQLRIPVHATAAAHDVPGLADSICNCREFQQSQIP